MPRRQGRGRGRNHLGKLPACAGGSPVMGLTHVRWIKKTVKTRRCADPDVCWIRRPRCFCRPGPPLGRFKKKMCMGQLYGLGRMVERANTWFCGPGLTVERETQALLCGPGRTLQRENMCFVRRCGRTIERHTFSREVRASSAKCSRDARETAHNLRNIRRVSHPFRVLRLQVCYFAIYYCMRDIVVLESR